MKVYRTDVCSLSHNAKVVATVNLWNLRKAELAQSPFCLSLGSLLNPLFRDQWVNDNKQSR